MPSATAQQDSDSDQLDAMLATLLREVEVHPDHSDSWRLLGRVYEKKGKRKQAVDAYVRAIHALFDNPAAHYDLGTLLDDMNRPAHAQYHYRQVFELAPDSQYAQNLIERGVSQEWQSTARQTDGPEAENSGDDVDGERGSPLRVVADLEGDRPGIDGATGDVMPASFEIQTFDGSDDLNRRVDQVRSEWVEGKRWSGYLEWGTLYNSNVTLSPISRELVNVDAASSQLIANPEFQWTAIQQDAWRAGPLGRGYFAVNESHLSWLDLASFQPGAYVERDLSWFATPVVGRLDYLYAIDLFGGDTLGDRHSVTASLTAFEGSGDIVYGYLTMAYSQFRDDGPLPVFDSQDGATYTLGISRNFWTGIDRIPTWSIGMNLETADTEGADFRYSSIRLHGDSSWVLTKRLELITSCGLGFRDYPDFSGRIKRDEVTWRMAGRLRHQLNSATAISLVANYDRFATDNPNFDANRLTAGVVSTIQY